LDMRIGPATIKFGAMVVAVLFLSQPMAHADRFVATNGVGTTNYTSWETAASNIQVALSVANPSETVWVSNGTYVITNQIAVTNRAASLIGVNGYTKTIVSMDPLYTNRCFFVSNAILDGFTVSNGRLSGAVNYSGGAGIYVTRTGTVRNCYLANNICSYTGTYSGGGGMWASNSMISNCVFCQNQAVQGAFSANSGYGGGIYCFKDSLVLNSTFATNSAANGGGGAALVGGNVRNSTFSQNTSGTNGGGGAYISASGSLSNCVVFGNTNAAWAAGIYVIGAAGSVAVIDACLISNNICRSAGGIGGAGIVITNNGQIRNCLIANNTNLSSDSFGGGVQLANAGSNTNTAGLLNCTVVSNYSINDGGGIAVIGPSNYVVNSIFFANSSSSNNYPNVYNTGSNSNNFWYCCANVASAPLPSGQGNITNNPALAATLRLSGNSPCINAGSNQTWMINAVDLDGKARIRYGTNDMGAYERINEATTYRVFQ